MRLLAIVLTLYLCTGVCISALAADPDTDADGQTDVEEQLAGTDPENDRSVRWLNISSFRFDTPALTGEAGQSPLFSQNVLTVPGFRGTAASITSSNGPAGVRYRGVENSGKVNLAPKRGAIWLRIKPYWFSKDTSFDGPGEVWGGLGPGHWATLIQTPDFSLRFDPDGNKLYLTTRMPNGSTSNNIVTPDLQIFADNPSQRDHPSDPGVGIWYNILLNYAPHPEKSSITLVSTGLRFEGNGIIASHTPAAEQFISIGANTNATEQFEGIIDEVLVFNVPSAFAETTPQLSAISSNSPPGIHLVWNATATNGVVDIQRRVVGSDVWQSLSGAIGTNYFDATAEAGERYEYTLTTDIYHPVHGLPVFDPGRSITATRDGRAIEDRGKVILLVDRTLTNALRNDISGFISDLVGDGWQVLRADVPRHVDDNSSQDSFQTNAFNIATVIAPFIRDQYAQHSSSIKQIIILGHVTIPYSGTFADDGHNSTGGGFFSHVGAWPADLYYGDIDGIWTDTLLSAGSFFEWNRNYPGDGRFDQNVVPANANGEPKLEVPVCRIDFSRLPAFSSQNETTLLRRYLAKNKAYRHGLAQYNADAFGNDTSVPGLFLPSGVPTAGEMASKLALLRPPLTGEPFNDPRNALIASMSGPGKFDRVNDARVNQVTTTNLATGETTTNVAFFFIQTSYAPDWNTENNFMRAILGTRNGGLASAGMFLDRAWRVDGMAAGLTLGSDILNVVNAWSATNVPISQRWVEILGDATLRFPVTKPPGPVTWIVTGNQIELNWSHPEGETPRYNIYRSVNGISGQFTRENAAPRTGTRFTDRLPNSGQVVYMIRTVLPVTTGAGTYTNLSQGVFAPEISNLAPIPNQTIEPQVPLEPVLFSLGSAANDPTLELAALSSDETVVPNANIAVTGTEEGSLTLTAVKAGTAEITVSIKTSSTVMNKTFTVTALAVNNPPTFTKGPDITVAQNPGSQLFPGWATAISPGSIDEADQTVSFQLSTPQSYLFAVAPAVNSEGNLTFTPSPNARGTASVTIRAVDDGGTANGGNDTSPPQAFTITIGVSTDSDNDGLPDDYETTFGFNPGDPSNANQDTDGDRFSNLAEFWAGTDPLTARSLLEFTQTSYENDVWRLFFSTVQGRSYSVQFKDDFPEGVWLNLLPAPLEGTGGVLEVTDTLGHSLRLNRVYRVVVQGGENVVSSGYAGFWRMGLLGQSDTRVSMPFIRSPVTWGLVQSFSGNVVQRTADIPWADNIWQYNGTDQTNTYFFLIASGPLEGEYFTITANGPQSVTLDLEGGSLDGLVPGTRFMIAPYWTLGTIFQGGMGVHPQVTRDRPTEVLLPDLNGVGINLAPQKTFSYLSNFWQQVGSSGENKNDDVILPDMFVIVRHTIPLGTQLTAHGLVLPTKLRIGLRRDPTNLQDNFVALPRPAPVNLSESGLFQSGAFRASTGRDRIDTLLRYFNHTPVLNRAPSETYYYQDDAWRLLGELAPKDNVDVIQPGTGFLLRLGPAAEPVIWVNSPNY